MTAKEAIEFYKSRDVNEKLFGAYESYLRNKSIQVYAEETAKAKIFFEFVALFIRRRIYTCLKDEREKLGKNPNFITLPAALKELEKIEMVRRLDNVYRMEHVVTARPKMILKAFGMYAGHVRHLESELSEELQRRERKNGKQQKVWEAGTAG